MRALADIADRWGSGELRLTVWQNLILPNVPTAHLDDVTNALLAAGLDYRAGRVLSGTVACTGSQGCRFAATDTKSHAVALAATLDKLAIIDQPINLHVTGCHNSCAQHYIGDIGMMGVKTAGEEGYQVNLGGGADSDQGIARELFPAVRWTQVEPLLSGLVTTYGRTRQPRESFLAFTRRHSIEELRGMCPQELQEQPTI
jgi:ferredoxin-nitrite reductase